MDILSTIEVVEFVLDGPRKLLIGELTPTNIVTELLYC